MQVWDRVVQLYKGHQCIHHGQEEGSNHQEAPPHDDDVLVILLCDKLCVLILPNMLQNCSDGPLWSADSKVTCFGSSLSVQRCLLNMIWEDCGNAWPDLMARLLCGSLIVEVPKQHWIMTQSHSEVAVPWLQGNSFSQQSCCL